MKDEQVIARMHNDLRALSTSEMYQCAKRVLEIIKERDEARRAEELMTEAYRAMAIARDEAVVSALDEYHKLVGQRDEARRYGVAVKRGYDELLGHACENFPGLYDYLLAFPDFSIPYPSWEKK